MEMVMWWTFTLIKWLDSIRIPFEVWNINGKAYSGLHLISGYMAKLPFIPWDAMAVAVTAVVTVWFLFYVVSVVWKVVLLKWGGGSGGDGK